MSAPAPGRLPALLNLKLNPTGYMAAAGAIYAAVVMIYNAHYNHGVISTPVIIAALAAAWALYTRTAVTPVAAPRDGNGNRLVPEVQEPEPLAPAVLASPVSPPPAVPPAAGLAGRLLLLNGRIAPAGGHCRG